jgi:hypothetical protein
MGQYLVLALAMVFVFVAVATVLMKVIPGPHKETDYLVIGTVSTFASLAVLFVVLVTTIFKDSNALFVRRKKE